MKVFYNFGVSLKKPLPVITKTKTLEKLTVEQALTAYDFYKMLAKDSFVLLYMGIFDDQLTSILMDINDVQAIV